MSITRQQYSLVKHGWDATNFDLTKSALIASLYITLFKKISIL
jgi:hypothetical protein